MTDEDDQELIAPHRVVSDRGRRCAEAYNAARARGGAGRFVAIRLSDGRSDGVIYDTKDDAVGHQVHETQCAYLVVNAFAEMTDAEGTALLDVHERAYDAGYRLTDPDTVIGARLAPVVNRRERRAMARGQLVIPTQGYRRRW